MPNHFRVRTCLLSQRYSLLVVLHCQWYLTQHIVCLAKGDLCPAFSIESLRFFEFYYCFVSVALVSVGQSQSSVYLRTHRVQKLGLAQRSDRLIPLLLVRIELAQPEERFRLVRVEMMGLAELLFRLHRFALTEQRDSQDDVRVSAVRPYLQGFTSNLLCLGELSLTEKCRCHSHIGLYELRVCCDCLVHAPLLFQ